MENQDLNQDPSQEDLAKKTGRKLTDEELKDLPGHVSEQTTSAAMSGSDSRDEDAADDDYAASGDPKSFERDQSELDLGLDDGDFDADIDNDH
jgi:hypothetical protein